jgi:hypothetical protein
MRTRLLDAERDDPRVPVGVDGCRHGPPESGQKGLKRVATHPAQEGP